MPWVWTTLKSICTGRVISPRRNASPPFPALSGQTLQMRPLPFPVPISPHHVRYLLSAQMACPGRKRPGCGPQAGITKAPTSPLHAPGLREPGPGRRQEGGRPLGGPLPFPEKAEVARVLLLPELSRGCPRCSPGTGRWGRR